jgi:tRNA G18 (ribose-2'-O)-methylase SpoU
MPVLPLTTLDDPRLEPYRRLKHSNLTRWSGRFIAEGPRVVRRLLESGFKTESILLSDRKRSFLEAGVPEHLDVLLLAQELAEQLVGYNFHQGVMACGLRGDAPLLESLVGAAPGPAPLLVACPRMTDPDNLGGLVRLCAAFGVAGLLLGRGCADPFSRRSLRISMGAAFHVPIVEPDDLAADLALLRSRHGFRLTATVLDNSATALAQLTGVARRVLLLGNEADGLGREWIDVCDERLTIPMAAGADSLNVTVAAGIVLHHLTHVLPRPGSGLRR